MSINENLDKIKPFYSLVVVLLLCGIFFYIGRISVTQSEKKESFSVIYNDQNLAQAISYKTSTSTTNTANILTQNATSGLKQTISSQSQNVNADGNVIASKTGKKYYFPWCGTVKRIKAENQVFFRTISEAKSEGYLPGGNCKGLW